MNLIQARLENHKTQENTGSRKFGYRKQVSQETNYLVTQNTTASQSLFIRFSSNLTNHANNRLFLPFLISFYFLPKLAVRICLYLGA